MYYQQLYGSFSGSKKTLCCTVLQMPLVSVFSSPYLQSQWMVHNRRLTNMFCQQLQLLAPLAGYQSGIGFLSQCLCSSWMANLEISSKLQYTIEQMVRYTAVIHSDDVSQSSHLDLIISVSLLDSKQSKTSRLETGSYQWMPRMEQRALASYLMCLQYKVQDTYLYTSRREGITTALRTFNFAKI